MLLGDEAVARLRAAGRRRAPDRGGGRAGAGGRQHTPLALGRRPRRQRSVHHREPRRPFRLRRGRAGHRRVPEQRAVLGRVDPRAPNALAPGRRADHAVSRLGRASGGRAPVLALGTPGGSGIGPDRRRRRWCSTSISACRCRTPSTPRARGCGTGGGSSPRAGSPPRCWRRCAGGATTSPQAGLDHGGRRDAGGGRRSRDRGDDRGGRPAARRLRGDRLRSDRAGRYRNRAAVRSRPAAARHRHRGGDAIRARAIRAPAIRAAARASRHARRAPALRRPAPPSRPARRRRRTGRFVCSWLSPLRGSGPAAQGIQPADPGETLATPWR